LATCFWYNRTRALAAGSLKIWKKLLAISRQLLAPALCSCHCCLILEAGNFHCSWSTRYLT
jgi:hypothetical protein